MGTAIKMCAIIKKQTLSQYNLHKIEEGKFSQKQDNVEKVINEILIV